MWQTIFIQPIVNLLVALYSALPIHDLGLSLILVVILIRIVIFPLSRKAAHTQFAMQKLQPEITRIQKEYKNDREMQTKELLQLYRDHQMNPFSSIVLLFVQLPVLIALYQVFLRIVRDPNLADLLYGFVKSPGMLQTAFLGFVDLAKPNVVLTVLAAGAQFLQTKRISPALPAKEHSQHSFQTMMARQMLYLGPLLTFFILSSLPSVIGLYWFVTSLWSLLEYRLVLKPEPAAP